MPTDDGRRLDTELTAARLAVNDWHACASNDELDRWRRAQLRLIDAAKAVGRHAALIERLTHALNDCEIHAHLEGIKERTACAVCLTEALAEIERLRQEVR